MAEVFGVAIPRGFFYILMAALVVGGAILILMAAKAFLGTLLGAFVPGQSRERFTRKVSRLVLCFVVAAVGAALIVLAGAPLLGLANTLKG